MNAEFFEAITLLGHEKGLDPQYLMEKVQGAIIIAVKKDYEVDEENVKVVMDAEKAKFSVSIIKEIVEEVENKNTQVSLTEALKKRKTAKVGGTITIPLKTKDFRRIAAQTAKHVIRQGIKEAERSQM